MRVFLVLDPDDGPNLLPTPSTSGWAARFPAIFSVTGEQDLDRATALILKSQAGTKGTGQRNTSPRPDYWTSEELLPETKYAEGAARRVLVNAYERNRKAREKCLRHFGKICAVCEFSFETRYGPILAGYIHVHHLTPIAQVGKEYILDPIRDLRPVCPNCQAVIHRREPPFSLEEVKQMIREP